MSQITKAASVLLARGSGTAELFVVRRSEKLRFFGGFFAFPGGKVAPADSEIKVFPSNTASGNHDRRVTAARELFEETGILLARRTDGSFPPSGSVLDYLRRKTMAEQMTFQQVLDRLEVTIQAADFVPLGGLTTPPFVPNRFDTAFFLAVLPPTQHAQIWPGELAEGEWVTATAVLEQWTRGQCMVSPPTVMILQTILDQPIANISRKLSIAFGSLGNEALPPIFFAPAVQLVPLDTQSLPPSTHTNAYYIGQEKCYLLDPGTGYPQEQARLFALLDQQQAQGRKLSAVILTHHHPDHIGAATVCAERYSVPILAHPLTHKALEGRINIAGHIHDGEHLDLGMAPDGTRPWYLEAIHTPGHASGHLAFYEPYYRLLFAADMVSTLSSVVIAPPDGDLAVYLDSLRRLKNYDCRLLLPSHGSPSPRPCETIDECLAHRAQREEQLLAALGAAPRSIPELAVELYKGLTPKMMRFAELQVRAGVAKLEREGRIVAIATSNQERWSKRTTP